MENSAHIDNNGKMVRNDERNNNGKVSSRFTHYTAHKRVAFTLAEVLITLGIIGIIAALTIPALVTKYKKQVTANCLKVAYSLFNQALGLSVQHNGDTSSWEITSTGIAPKYILPYVEYVGKVKPYTMKSLYPEGIWLLWDRNNIYALKNGMIFTILYSQGVISLTVDINGQQGPNELGIDGFEFRILTTKNTLGTVCTSNNRDVLLGKNGSFTYGTCSRSTSGWEYYAGECCAKVIMMDGWQIKDDYPWK